MDEIKLLTKLDCAKALYNSYMQKLVMAEINLEYYNYKKTNPRNGEDSKLIEQNIIISERNVEDNNHMIKIFIDKIAVLEKENDK